MLIRKIEEVDYQDVYQLVKYELGYQNLEFNKFCWHLIKCFKIQTIKFMLQLSITE